jgi:hypothetical protein
VAEYLLGMLEALSSILSTEKKKEKRGKKQICDFLILYSLQDLKFALFVNEVNENILMLLHLFSVSFGHYFM